MLSLRACNSRLALPTKVDTPDVPPYKFPYVNGGVAWYFSMGSDHLATRADLHDRRPK